MTATMLALCAATLLVSLVAGFLFAFAVVVMPGIGRLEDDAFIRAFQRIDGVIQRGDLLFGLVFLGSIAAVLASAGLGMGALSGLDRVLLLTAAMLYVAGVLLPTGLVNVPLNHRLQQLDVATLEPEERRAGRLAFEPRWNRWNRIRTGLACATAALLVLLLVRL